MVLGHKGSPRILEPIPSPRDLPDPGIEPGSPELQADSLPTELSVEPSNSLGLIISLYWGKAFLSTRPNAHEFWHFPAWLVGVSTIPSGPYSGSFPASGDFLPHMWSGILCWIPEGNASQISKFLSWGSCLMSGTLSYKLMFPQSLHFLSSISS